MLNKNLKYFILFIGLIFLQIIFTNNFILFGYGFCFIYVVFIVLLPIDFSPVLLLFLALILGLLVDIISNTLGINAGASVFLAFLRPSILKLFTPRGGYDNGFDINIFKAGWQWFISYAFLSIFAHHFFLFFLDALDINFLFDTFLKALFSTITVVVMLVLGEFLFARKR